MKKITQLPQSSDFIEGAMNLRGDLIIIVDLRKGSSLEPVRSSEARIIIIDINSRKTGLIVDSISEILDPPGGYLAFTKGDLWNNGGLY